MHDYPQNTCAPLSDDHIPPQQRSSPRLDAKDERLILMAYDIGTLEGQARNRQDTLNELAMTNEQLLATNTKLAETNKLNAERLARIERTYYDTQDELNRLRENQPKAKLLGRKGK